MFNGDVAKLAGCKHGTRSQATLRAKRIARADEMEESRRRAEENWGELTITVA